MLAKSLELENLLGNMTDPIADMIIRIKNASMTGGASTSFPASRVKESIATVLKEAGYITNITKKGKKVKKTICVDLLYKDGKPVVNGVKRISKPSKRVYKKASDIRPFRQGSGVYILSTPSGVFTDKNARENKVGGEVLFAIW